MKSTIKIDIALVSDERVIITRDSIISVVDKSGNEVISNARVQSINRSREPYVIDLDTSEKYNYINDTLILSNDEFFEKFNISVNGKLITSTPVPEKCIVEKHYLFGKRVSTKVKIIGCGDVVKIKYIDRRSISRTVKGRIYYIGEPNLAHLPSFIYPNTIHVISIDCSKKSNQKRIDIYHDDRRNNSSFNFIKKIKLVKNF